MEILNLNDKSKGTIDYDSFVFSGGECHIKIKSFALKVGSVKIITSVRNSEDIMRLLLATDALRRIGSARIELHIPYVPYARQDRVCNTGEALSIKVFADIINSQNYYVVTIFDPHSGVTPALINNCRVQSNHKFSLEALQSIYTKNHIYSPYLVSPDSGANKKSKDLVKYLNTINDIDLLKCDKTRDVMTGQITGFEVYADNLKGKDCVIVDDICDGGGTFIGLAEELNHKHAGDIYLVVSHGIFSKGIEPLIEGGIKHIYTTDSFCQLKSNHLTIINYESN